MMSLLNLKRSSKSWNYIKKYNCKMCSSIRNFEEIQIEVPWGHIAGKWWGPKNQRPILGLHGWQDNCGTFDLLAQYLPSDIPFFAIDLPGHGFSSHIPPGFYYNGFDLVITVRRLMKHFGWPKVSLIGHSLGGITSYLYASTFPQIVDFIVSFDTKEPMTGITDEVQCNSKVIDKFLFYDEINSKSDEPPSYPLDSLDLLLYEGTGKSVDLDKCKYLLTRNIKQSEKDSNKYYFTRDPRVKTQFFMAWFYSKLLEDGHSIQCPVMEIESRSNFLNHKKFYIYQNVTKIFENNNKSFQIKKINGTHHLHLNNAKEVAELINPFIEKNYSNCNKLKSVL